MKNSDSATWLRPGTRQCLLRRALIKSMGYTDEEIKYLYSYGEVKSRTYDPSNDKIQIIEKDGSTTEISDASDILNTNTVARKTSKHYLCYAQVFEENIEGN